MRLKLPNERGWWVRVRTHTGKPCDRCNRSGATRRSFTRFYFDGSNSGLHGFGKSQPNDYWFKVKEPSEKVTFHSFFKTSSGFPR